MKFCGNCGTQLEDSALFCGQCGMKQVYQIQQQVQPQQIQQQPIQQQYAQPQQVQQYYAQPQQQNSGKTKKRKSGKKKYVLVPLLLLLLVAIGFGAFFMFFDKDKSSGSKKNSKGGNNAQGSEEKVLEDVLDDYGSHGSQEQVLDEYFQDLSNMDFDAIVKLNSPKSDEMYNVGLDKVTLAEMLTQMYNYPRSLTIDNSSYMLLNTEVGDIFLKSYGFPGYEEGGMDEYRKTNQDNDLFREKHKDFKAEYELISLKSASECTISYGNGTRPVSDMKDYISKDMDLEVDDVYVAKIHIQWFYGDKKYGYDPTWWDNAEYKRIIDDWGLYDSRKGETVHSYDEFMDYFDNLVYDVFLYEVDGDWYIYNIDMRSNGMDWQVE